MTRKQAILTLLCMPMGFFRAYRSDAAQKSGSAVLRIPLDQWKAIEVEWDQRKIVIGPKEIFEALENGHGH